MQFLAMVKKHDLIKRLKMHEWEDFEVKVAKNEVPKSAWETVSSFSNTEGGNLVFGIKDNGGGKYEVTSVENADKIQSDFLSAFSYKEGPEYKKKLMRLKDMIGK